MDADVHGLTRRGALALLAGLAACSDPDASYRNRIDTGWHRDDLEALMLHWHHHAPRPDGSFQCRFDRTWKPLPQAEVTSAQQAHLVYAFAAAHEYMPDAGCLPIAKRGASYLLLRFRDETHGGFFHSVDAQGRPQSMDKHADDHAFVLQALAEMYRVSGDVRYRDAAQQALQDVERGFSDPQGGLYTACARDFQPQEGPRTQAPVMHMFDALLALRAASGDKPAEQAARRLGDFTTGTLLQGLADGGALIPEVFDAQWKPAATPAGDGTVDLGHQFAWSHLLASGAAVSPVYAQVSERVFAHAMATGYDEAEGGSRSRAMPDGRNTDLSKGWWQQAECLRALLVAAQGSGRPDLWRRYEQTQAFIKKQLVDAEHGGWRLARSLPCRPDTCLDEQPDPYPIVRLHQAALKAAS